MVLWVAAFGDLGFRAFGVDWVIGFRVFRFRLLRF